MTVWAMPTAATVKAAYPAFADVDDGVIDTTIELATDLVTQSLPTQAVFTQAATLMVCHELTMSGHGTGAEADMVRQGVTGLASVSDGATSFTRQQIGDGQETILATAYGRRFKELVKRFICPFAVMAGDQ